MKRRSNLNRVLVFIFVTIAMIWVFLPIFMAVLWSLVGSDSSWRYPNVFPSSLSTERWGDLWNTSSLPSAIWNSYRLAPATGLVAVVVATPTAFAFGRRDFRGKQIAQVASLLPIVLPGFAIAIFLASILLQLNLYNRYLSILLGQTILTIPYAIRILSAAFARVPQDLIDASRNLGAGPFARFRQVYLPLLTPAYAASFIIIFILSIEEFALAFVIGAPDFTTIPTILFSYLGYQFIRPNAAVVSLILVVPNVIILIFLERLLETAGIDSGTKG